MLLFVSLATFGQSSSDLEQDLKELSKERKGLKETLRIDVEGLVLHEFIATVAQEHEINVSVSPDLDDIITSNFYDMKVLDILLFVIKRYDLEVRIINQIIVFNRKKVVEVEPVVVTRKAIDVSFNPKNEFLSVKLKNDTLARVASAITDASGHNVVLAPDIKEMLVSSYILNRPFDQVIEMMAKSNNLLVANDEDDFYYLSKNTTPKVAQTSNPRQRTAGRGGGVKRNVGSGEYTLTLDDQGFINIESDGAYAGAIIKEASDLLKVNYFMYDVPEESTTITMTANGVTYDDLLNHMFNGKKYTYKTVDDLFIFGAHTTEGLRETQLVQLENRTIETVLETLPKNLTTNLEIKEFPELNGFIVSGSPVQIEMFETYISEIDIVVPVIQIEVMIVQYQKSFDIRTGLQLGIDQEARTTSGVLLPSTDITANASSINNLIDSFNGLGWINLGKVSKDFYANLKAMESNSLLKISSTPKLVTLNGHEATSSIGETSYYFEQNNQLINSGLNNNVLQSGSWQSTEANLSINIKPVVSKDEHVTLDIAVEKSAFLGRAGENAPPGKSTQRFESMIRVKNNEMILLGGLDELERENSGSGAPLLSRIPVLKWFFSNRTKRKDKSKLHIFIKPTVIY